MSKRKFDDGHTQGTYCASKKGHVEIFLEPKVDKDIVSPTSPSKGEANQAFVMDESPKSIPDKGLRILPPRVIRDDGESPQVKVVRKRLKTHRPTSEELEKRFSKLWKTYGQ